MSKKAIYAEDLLCAIRDDPDINGTNFARVREHIEAATELDAVEVVRCKECIYNEKSSCMFSAFANPHYRPDYFCADGERREGE